ncbi:MAG: biotin--[acetyl-CoA-carboxylase] ligase [Muribaculaceae bacterium]|nr:biotin--[acetyl-CoA-carboxylase] ligase [Muribaculaceae bacterium]
MKSITLSSAPSTNAYVAAHADTLPCPCVVRAVDQTAGRGQRGNHWESEPGKNLTVSYYLRPEGVHPREQFAISEAIALAVADTLRRYGVEARVKWPNDIYVGDLKICGILIEHSLYGTEIRHSIAGIGLDVNQTVFLSDAPNPVSMANLTGREYDLVEVMEILSQNVERRMKCVRTPEGRILLHDEFKRNLWRGEGGPWPFRDTATGRTFAARIADITPAGLLTLRVEEASEVEEASGLLRPAETKTYAFKEVSFIL